MLMIAIDVNGKGRRMKAAQVLHQRSDHKEQTDAGPALPQLDLAQKAPVA